jgi:hypothetical protein
MLVLGIHLSFAWERVKLPVVLRPFASETNWHHPRYCSKRAKTPEHSIDETLPMIGVDTWQSEKKLARKGGLLYLKSIRAIHYLEGGTVERCNV